MVADQTRNLHLPMIVGLARDLRRRRHKGRLGRLKRGLRGPDPYGQSDTYGQPGSYGNDYGDDFWQDYVYDTTQGVIQILDDRYGAGQYYPAAQSQYGQPQQPQPGAYQIPRPMTPAVKPQTSGNTLTLSTNTLMLIVGGALLYFAGKKGR